MPHDTPRRSDTGDTRSGDTADRARELAAEAGGPVDTPQDAISGTPRPHPAERDLYGDTTGALDRSDQIRAADDARTDDRQERLARLEADAAERLRRNAETLRRTAEDMAETRERVRRIAADTRELAADVRQTREDTSRVGEAVRGTPPAVEPPAGGE